ncbi:hypothetical protein ACJ41O_013270 [Fusarium nematophilum]
MKTPLFSLLVLCISTRFCTTTRTPQWQWDPETIDSCIEWYNHEAGDEPCEYVRDYFNISPEDFTKWNPSVGPSPTAWSALGCYVDNTTTPILEERMSKEDGDAALTIPKCQDACYLAQFQFAGVKGGNECWCSSYVAGEWTRNQTDCNMPCSGNKTESCGGKGLVNVFEPDMEDEDWLKDETEVTDEKEAKGEREEKDENGVVNVQSSTSGAMRNLAFF